MTQPRPEHDSTAAYEYDLPKDRIASHPVGDRDASKLLVLDRASDDLEHLRFRDLPRLLRPGDVLVLNETRVLRARLLGRRPTGGRAEVLLVQPVGAGPAQARMWRALVRPGSRLRPGATVTVGDQLSIRVVSKESDGTRVVELVTDLPTDLVLERYGQVPLPPYLDRDPEPADADRYQTVFAQVEGSVAAPTAGLHFTTDLLTRIQDAGVEVARIVLHVGPGTFRPVDAHDPIDHVMHSERFEIGEGAAAVVNASRERGGHVWAVGTTVVRTLESVARDDGMILASEGETSLFIRPPYRFKVVDRLVTNFHLPRSTLLMLVAAFAGFEPVMNAYEAAIQSGYRFYSYGDAMAVI